jgi:hypothetical protein
VKRSQHVRRVLLGGLSAGALTACTVAAHAASVTTESYFTNDEHIPGAGYYHAPFRAFYAHPYNYYDATRKEYYYGGQWGPAPYRSIVNISTPTPEAARAAEAVRTDVRRSGFGSTATSHSISS